jgi:hypothetical protein
MKSITLKEFKKELDKAYAVETAGHVWTKDRLGFAWRKGKTYWCHRDDINKFELDEENLDSFVVSNGCAGLNLLHYQEDEIIYDEVSDEYTMINNNEKTIETDEYDDDGYKIRKGTGEMVKDKQKLIMLYRKNEN